MGNCNYKASSTEEGQTITKNHFKFHCIVGKGGFGKVSETVLVWLSLGVANWKEKVQNLVCDEGNEQGAHRQQKVRQLSH